MSEFYDDFALTADELLGEAGQVVTLTKKAAGTYDASTGVKTPGATTTQTISGVEETYSSFSIDGTLIKAGDKKFHLSPLDSSGAVIVAPEAEDTITFSGDAKPWTIKKVDPVSPGGQPVLFTLQLRRS